MTIQTDTQNQNASPKPEWVVDLGGTAPPVLPALSCLSALKKDASFHVPQDRRHPLGVYNLSTGRICDKVTKCAANLERFCLISSRLSELDKEPDLRNSIIDYLELCLYAAAEHVDDIEIIVECFFATREQAAKGAEARALKRALKPLRDRIVSFTNTMKHGQGRLRLFSVEFDHDGIETCLHGFFVEGFSNGKVCPNPILHAKGEIVVSITSFLWSILIYIWLISLELQKLLVSISALVAGEIRPIGSSPLRKAVIRLTRLPLYSMDETHPFEQVRVVVRGDAQSEGELKSNLYGSLRDRWSKSNQGRFGSTRLQYEGDGASRSFQMVGPKQIQLAHWE